MKKYIPLFLLLASLMSGTTYARTFIGYGTADSVAPKATQELVLMGFEAGFEKTIQKELNDDFIAVDFDIGGSPLGAIKSAERLIKKGAQILTGFPTSHEALLVSKIAKKNNIMVIFSSAGHSQLGKMGDDIYSVAESIDYAMNFKLKFMQDKFGKQKGLILINPKAVYSVSHLADIRNLLKDPKFSSINIDMINLNMNLEIPKTVIQALKTGKYKYLHLTMYAEEAVPLLRQLHQNHIDIPIVASTSWDDSDIDVIRRYLFGRKSPTYGFAQWNRNSTDAKEFERFIRKKYNREPTGGMVYGYDLGVIMATTINRIEGDMTMESFKKAFKKNLCFEKTSNGTICFSPNGGHAKRKIYTFEFQEKYFK